MQFSEKTLKILDNFADINPSVLFEEGNLIYTIAPNKTIFAKAKVDEDIDGEAGVYNLKSFIKVLSMFKDPEIEFKNNNFLISDDRQKLSYTYAAKNMIMVPQKKTIKMPAAEVELDVKWEDIAKTREFAAVLGMEHLSITGDGNEISLQVYDPKNPTSDKYNVTLETDDVPDEPFSILIKTSNLKLLPDNYRISIAIDKLAKFESETIEYYIALEKAQ